MLPLNIIFDHGYNKDSDNGGAISFEGNAVATLINCTFQNCWAENNGGAIADRTGNTLTLIGCTFLGNSVRDADGGAIYCKGPIYAEGYTFSSNEADDYGAQLILNQTTHQHSRSAYSNPILLAMTMEEQSFQMAF